ncbi:MAG: AsmA family protein [Alphaproteobacteria bacterium]
MVKKLFFSVVVLVLMLSVIALVVPAFISQDTVRNYVQQEVSRVLGHKFTVKGNLKFTAFPYISVYMDDVAIHAANISNPLLTAKSFDVAVKTFSLLRGDIKINRLIIDAPVMVYSINSKRKSNWDAGAKPLPPTHPIYRKIQEETDTAAMDFIKNLSLDDIRIVNGVLTYNNDLTKEKMRLNAINLAIELEGMNEPFKLKGSTDLNGKKIVLDGIIETPLSLLSTKKARIDIAAQSDLISFNAKGDFESWNFKGALDMQSPDVLHISEWLTNKHDNSVQKMKIPIALKTQSDCNLNECSFNDSEVAVDDMKATGRVKLIFSGVLPYIELHLDMQDLNLNKFRQTPHPVTSSVVFASAYAEPPSGWSDEVMDFSFLKAFEMYADVKTQQITVDNITIGKSLFRARQKRGKLNVDIIDSEFYGGKANIFAAVDVSRDIPQIEKKLSFSKINMEKLLKDADISDRFSGVCDFDMSMVASGNSQRSIVSSTHGSGKINCADGSIKGINIAEMIRNVQSAFKPVDKTSQKTDFSEAGGTFNITKGVLSNNDFAMKSPLFRVKGEGNVNFPLRSVKYRLLPQIVETIQGQGGKDKEGFGVPVIIEGSFDNLSYRPDLEATVKEAIKNPEKVKETIGNIKQQLKEGKGGLKDLLKKF